MRKPIAVMAIALCALLCAATLVQAGSRENETTAPSASADPRGPLTLHRILRGRLQLTLRLAQAAGFVVQPAPVEEPVSRTRGIIDEPDPAGKKYERKSEEDRGQQRRRREQSGMNRSKSGEALVGLQARPEP
jgi:hypothetical protein